MNWKTFLKQTGVRFLAVVVAAVLVVLLINGLLSGRAGFVSNLDGKLREPFQQAASTAAGWLEGLYGSVYKYDQLQAENDALRNQLAEEKQKVRDAEEAVELIVAKLKEKHII